MGLQRRIKTSKKERVLVDNARQEMPFQAEYGGKKCANEKTKHRNRIWAGLRHIGAPVAARPAYLEPGNQRVSEF